MNPGFCVCVCNNAHWFLSDYGNDRRQPFLAWTIDPAHAHRFTRHEAAIVVAQMVKHAYPDQTVRLMVLPQNKVRHDSNPA